MVAHSLRSVRFAGVAFATALLSGCASFSSDGGMTAVSEMTAPALRADVAALRSDDDIAAADGAVAALLKRPLNADSAVQIALLNNRDLQAAYNELGIAEAVRVRASLPPAPKFHLSRMAGGGGFEIEAQIVASILSLATLPSRADIATDRFHQAQLRAVEATLRTGFEARRAFTDAVAARRLAGYLAQAQSSAQAAVDLSKRLGESGSATKLDRARHEVFYAETAARLSGARQRAAAGRERLVRALGLSGRDLAFALPATLPAVPARTINVKEVETEAIRRRADLQIARLEVEALAKTYGLTNATRFVNLLDVSGTHKRVENSAGEVEKERGLGVEFQVPLFDFGEVSAREAKATYAQAVNRLSAKAVNVASEAREAHAQYRAAFDVARRYQRDVLPLRKTITEETLLRYNAMQIDVFALLVESRERIAATIAAIEAQRDFWLADTNLKSAVLGGHGGSGNSSPPAMASASAEPAGH
jgi:outer membrane protein TolC